MEYNPLEVLSLMMPTMSDTGDEFCTAVRSLPPLLLTQALAGAPISAVESPLLTLPDELLNLIIGMLEPQDLANFAFVNSDCRQLARVVQFEHVKVDYPNMDRVQVNRDSVRIMEKFPPTPRCRLATLDFQATRTFGVTQDEPGGPNPSFSFIAFLLRRCQSTLTSLIWRDVWPIEEGEVRPELPKLKCLRKLCLQNTSLRSSAELQALILPDPECQLAHLDLGIMNDVTAELINQRGNISTLKAFCCSGSKGRRRISTRFLKENRQLESLSLEYLPKSAVEERILPLLAEKFQNLVSLEIAYDEDGKSVSPTAFEAIATLKTLEQLHLSAGSMYGWKHQWIVDHNMVRKCVKQLPALKRLALSRDTYKRRLDFDGNNPENYYSSRTFLEEDEHEGRLRVRAIFWTPDEIADRPDDDSLTMDDDTWTKRADWAWEMMHRHKMLQQANKYVNLRYNGGPKLEFLCFGKLPMEVKLGWYGWRAIAVTEKRDEAYTMLNRMFKGAGDLFAKN